MTPFLVKALPTKIYDHNVTAIGTVTAPSVVVTGQTASKVLVTNSDKAITSSSVDAANIQNATKIQGVAINASAPTTNKILKYNNSTTQWEAAGITTGLDGVLPIANGGTAVSSVTTAPIPGAFAGWDANTNLSAFNFLTGFVSHAAGTGPFTIAEDTKGLWIITGEGTETLNMGAVTGMANGQTWTIHNLSNDVLTVNTSGTDVIQVMSPFTKLVLTVKDKTAGTGTDSWLWAYGPLQVENFGITELSGDVNSEEGPGNVDSIVQGIQGVDVSDTPPNDGDVLSYNDSDGEWKPTPPATFDLADHFVYVPSGDYQGFWILFNATYDAGDDGFDRIDVDSVASAIHMSTLIPFEASTGGIQTWFAQPGSNPIGNFASEGGWQLGSTDTEHGNLVVRNGIELDGDGNFPFYARFMHSEIDSDGWTGILTNLFLDGSGVDDDTSPSWFAGIKDDHFTVCRAAAGDETFEDFVCDFDIDSTGQATFSNEVSFTGGVGFTDPETIDRLGKNAAFFCGGSSNVSAGQSPDPWVSNITNISSGACTFDIDFSGTPFCSLQLVDTVGGKSVAITAKDDAQITVHCADHDGTNCTGFEAEIMCNR